MDIAEGSRGKKTEMGVGGGGYLLSLNGSKVEI